jgi:hypothetical protein
LTILMTLIATWSGTCLRVLCLPGAHLPGNDHSCRGICCD